MKKTIAALLAGILFLGSVTIFADIPDISGLTDDEIVSLHELIQQELVNRNIHKVASLSSGTYVGGKDIPVGSYELYIEGPGSGFDTVYILKSADDTTLGNTTLYEYIDEEEFPVTYHITMEEGYVLNMPLSGTLTISNGVSFQ